MAKQIEVIFKGNAPCGKDGYGKVETVGEKELDVLKSTGMYDIEVVTKKSDTVDSSNTVKEIKAYLDKEGISYKTTDDTKAKLLALLD